MNNPRVEPLFLKAERLSTSAEVLAIKAALDEAYKNEDYDAFKKQIKSIEHDITTLLALCFAWTANYTPDNLVKVQHLHVLVAPRITFELQKVMTS